MSKAKVVTDVKSSGDVLKGDLYKNHMNPEEKAEIDIMVKTLDANVDYNRGEVGIFMGCESTHPLVPTIYDKSKFRWAVLFSNKENVQALVGITFKHVIPIYQEDLIAFVLCEKMMGLTKFEQEEPKTVNAIIYKNSKSMGRLLKGEEYASLMNPQEKAEIDIMVSTLDAKNVCQTEGMIMLCESSNRMVPHEYKSNFRWVVLFSNLQSFETLQGLTFSHVAPIYQKHLIGMVRITSTTKI